MLPTALYYSVTTIASTTINPFAPRDFAKKRVLKLVEWFSGAESKISRSGIQSDTAVLTFTFRFLSSPLFSLFLPLLQGI